jgi:hypothetical protein
VQYDVDLVWPANDVRIADAGNFIASGIRSGSPIANVWDAPVGPGYNQMGLDARGDWGAYFASDGLGAVVSRTVQAFKVYTALTALGLPAGFMTPSWHRLWRWQVPLRTTAATASVLTFVGFAPEAGAAAGTPDGAGNRFMGLRGAGDGTWLWASRTAGGGAYQESVLLGIPQLQPTVFDFVILEPTAVSGAVVQLYANGVLVLARAWAGGLLPTYANPANASHFTLMAGARDAGIAVQMIVGRCRFMSGQFQVDGSMI